MEPVANQWNQERCSERHQFYTYGGLFFFSSGVGQQYGNYGQLYVTHWLVHAACSYMCLLLCGNNGMDKLLISTTELGQCWSHSMLM
jgi:hypothetical protein